MALVTVVVDKASAVNSFHMTTVLVLMSSCLRVSALFRFRAAGKFEVPTDDVLPQIVYGITYYLMWTILVTNINMVRSLLEVT